MTNEMTISEIKAMYFDEDALILSPVKLFRYHYKGDRFYYYQPSAILNSKGEFDHPPIQFAAGVTTITRKTIPQDESLTRYIADLGWDAAIAYRDERAKYGSLLHTIAAELFINKSFDLDLIEEIVANYCIKNFLNVNQSQWADDLKQDILALAQFAADYNVKSLAIELSLVSVCLNFAGTLDLLCEMDKEEKGFFGEVYASGERKGQPKETKRTVRTLAIVDFKSGRNANGSLQNAAQLKMLEMLARENFLYEQEIALYNFHPKDWRTAPSYSLIDQTDKWTEESILHLLSIYSVYEKSPEEKTLTQLSGVVKLFEPLESNLKIEMIKEIVQKAVDEGDLPPEKYDSTENYFNYKLTEEK